MRCVALEAKSAQEGLVLTETQIVDRKTPITAADLLNDRVVPFFEQHDVKLLRVLTDRGSEYCGNPERHEFELYLAVEDIDHSRTKTKSPQTNGVCERFHKTVLNEFYRVAGPNNNAERCVVRRRGRGADDVVLRIVPGLPMNSVSQAPAPQFRT
jgi:transposase InsO family protein